MRFGGLAVQAVLGAVLVVAGAAKLGRLRAFAAVVRDYRMLPDSLLGSVAHGLPVAEVALGGLLLVGAVPRVAAALAACVFAGFALAIALNLWRGRLIECGCFGAEGSVIGWAALARAMWLLLAASALAILQPPLGASGQDRLAAGLVGAGALLGAATALRLRSVFRLTRAIEASP